MDEVAADVDRQSAMFINCILSRLATLHQVPDLIQNMTLLL